MNLPSGVYYRPLQKQLIATNAEALIRIDTVREPANGGYRVETCRFDTWFEQCLKGDWDAFDRVFHLDRLTEPNGTERVAVFAIATHEGMPRRPRMTVVPNLRAMEKGGTERPLHVLGCTLGRYYSKVPTGPVVREVYEFLSYGAIVIDRGTGEVDMVVARAGDKVVVTSGCRMALYNLGDVNAPLVTLDFSGDWSKVAEEQRLQEQFAQTVGPMLLIRYDDLEVQFLLNHLHVNNPTAKAGVRLPTEIVEKVDRSIRLQRTSRDDLGTFLYEQLTQNPALIARFAQLGIRIRHVAVDAALHSSAPETAKPLFFSRPLAAATAEGTRVYRFFFGGDEAVLRPAKARPPRPDALRPFDASTKPLDRRLVIVVEGAGDWVKKAYRQAFRDKLKEDETASLSVFYADDSTWKPPRDGKPVRPDWAVRGIEGGLADWEVYLDKADPDDAARYALLRPDAVFVVTPDFTHSETARFWLNKVPVVFVEKPFDSQVRNVEGLQFDFSRRPRTEIVGLDHYQFYAEPLKTLRPSIEKLLGRRVTRVEFALAEANAIEFERDRSLQHGLSLDLLPHFVALLTFFGDIRTIDEISIPKAWTYEPLESRTGGKSEDLSNTFKNETGAKIEFTMEDYSGNGYRVPCTAVVGKGFSIDAKYMDVYGETGRVLRIDLRKEPEEEDPDYDKYKKHYPEYPWDSLFFLAASADSFKPMNDPYHRGRKLRILTDEQQTIVREKLERRRYSSLLSDLLGGTETAAFSSLSMAQGGYIVKVLDRIWWSIQHSKPWEKHQLMKFDPIND